MPRRKLGARLWLQPAYGRRDGHIEPAVWCIKDGRNKHSTGYGLADCRSADHPALQDALATYLGERTQPSRQSNRSADQVAVGDVIAIYLADKVGGTARPKETAQRCKRLVEWWGDKTLAQVNGATCRAYAKARGSTASRRELEDLRAAINYHRNEGLCTEVVEVVLPERSPSRLRFLTRSEAARLLWAAYRYREVQKGHATGRHSRRHLARFILVALYTGTRSAAVCGAWLIPLTQVALDVVCREVGRVRSPGRTHDGQGALAFRIPEGIFAFSDEAAALRSYSNDAGRTASSALAAASAARRF